MGFTRLRNNLLSIDPWKVLAPILERHLDLIEELNRKQLSEGQKADGSSMPEYNNEEYAYFKVAEIPTYEIFPVVDLRYEGDFYREIKASLDLFGVNIESFDEKASKLESKYGSLIYGLTDISIGILVETIINEFVLAFEAEILKG